MRDACSQKVSKNQKIVCAQVTQTKTGLSAVRTFSPLGVNKKRLVLICLSWLTPKGPKAIFMPFLKFGQAIVKAIFIKNS
jgi:hypothetical protein